MKVFEINASVRTTLVMNADDLAEAKLNALELLQKDFPEAWEITINKAKEVKK
jgi:hypothetical protein